MSDPETTSGKKGGMVAIVGRANVGKSTLINALLEEKVSIVSPVPQTTRTLLRGILTEPRGQLVLLDTPGVHQADYDLGRLMNKKARAAVDGVDVIMLVLDRSQAPSMEDEGWIKRLVKSTLPVLAVLNKSDRTSRHDCEFKLLWETAAKEYSSPASIRWVEVSGLKGDGVKELRELLFELAPYGPPLFPDDILTDYPRKWTISDIVREKLFLVLKDELPHAIAVQVDSIEEKDNDWSVQATIYVDKPSQKPIVLGLKGRLLRRVRRSAEIELCTLYARNIDLRLWVKVEKNWNRNFWFLKKAGYTE